jgi:hypothetical protein
MLIIDGGYEFERLKMGPNWVWVCGLRYIPTIELTRLVCAHPYLRHLAPLYELRTHYQTEPPTTPPTPPSTTT